jgi:hypothetical protein
MLVNSAADSNTLSAAYPPASQTRSDDFAFQEAAFKAFAAVGTDSEASASALSPAPDAPAETLVALAQAGQLDREEAQRDCETLAEPSLNDMLRELYGDGPYTPAQINKAIAALNEDAAPPSTIEAGSQYYSVYQAARGEPWSRLSGGKYIIFPKVAGGSPGPEDASPDLRYDAAAGTVTMLVNGKRATAQFWGEGPQHLSLSDIAMPGEPWQGKTFAMRADGEGAFKIAPLVPLVLPSGHPVQLLWAGPGIPRTETDLEGIQFSDKYYNTNALDRNRYVIQPRRLGENLRPNTRVLFGLVKIPAALMREFENEKGARIAGLAPAQDDFAYDPKTRMVTIRRGNQTIEAEFVGYPEDPPTSARKIQIAGQPPQRGQSYTLHEVSPQGRTLFPDYIVVPRDPSSTEVSAFMPATVYPFDEADPVRPDEIAVLKTFFTEKIVDLVRLRSGALSSIDVIAAKLSGELSDAEMETLQRRHSTEFSQIYLTGGGHNGGGGTHFLIQGEETSVTAIIGPNVRAKQHTHPDSIGGVLCASNSDYREQQLLGELTPQQSQKVVPQNQPAFRYANAYAGRFEVNVDAQTVKLQIDGRLVTVPVLMRPEHSVRQYAVEMPKSAAEIQMPGDPWRGQGYQMYEDRYGNLFIVSSDYRNVSSDDVFSPFDWPPRDTLIVPLRDGQNVKAGFSDEVVSAVRSGGDRPASDNIRRPGAEDRGETYRLYQDFFSREWLIGFNVENIPRLPY